MQLFARYPFMMRRLRRLLQLALPVAVAADTARSVVVTYRLAQQRFAEWEEEEREDTQREVRTLLQRLAHRCACKDPDFWPQGLLPGGGGGGGEQDGGGGGGSAGSAADVWQLLGLDGSGGTAAAAAAADELAAGAEGGERQSGVLAAAAWAEAEAKEQMAHQMRREAAESAAAVSTAAAAQAAAAARTRVVMVTLNDAVAHVASGVASLELPWHQLMVPPPGVVRVTLSDVAAILGSTRPARLAARKRDRLGQRILAAADSARAAWRASSLPWPQMALRRRSALRYAVDWRGIHWPRPQQRPLELDLAACA